MSAAFERDAAPGNIARLAALQTNARREIPGSTRSHFGDLPSSDREQLIWGLALRILSSHLLPAIKLSEDWLEVNGHHTAPNRWLAETNACRAFFIAWKTDEIPSLLRGILRLLRLRTVEPPSCAHGLVPRLRAHRCSPARSQWKPWHAALHRRSAGVVEK
jgi:hypothetical protein